MKTTVETIINHLNCPYTLDGENLANLRRVKLQDIGKAIGVVGDMSKNELLTRIMAQLSAMGSEKELSKEAREAKAG
jgi:hypothetical protein